MSFKKLLLWLRDMQLPRGAIVTESKLLKDLLTGTEREVDICIEHELAGYQIIICIECIDRKRTATVEWVEQMKSKHERLPTNALVLVSRSGFSKEAVKVAEKNKITILGLEELNNQSVERIFKDTSSLRLKACRLKTTKVNIIVEKQLEPFQENVRVTSDNLIYNREGVELGTAMKAIESILRLEYIVKEIGSKINKDHNFFEIHYEPVVNDRGEHIYLKHLDNDELRLIKSIHIIGTVIPYISEFPLQQGKLGDEKIAWGQGNIFGEDAMIVTTESKTGETKLSISPDSITLKIPDPST